MLKQSSVSFALFLALSSLHAIADSTGHGHHSNPMPATGAPGAVDKSTAHKAQTSKSEMSLELVSAPVLNAGKIQLSFKLLESGSPKPVKNSNLQVLHEKKLHMLIYDEALQEFRHVHPQEKGGVWTTEVFRLDVNGKYWVWANGKVNGADDEFTTSVKIEIQNGKPEHTKRQSLGNKNEDVAQGSKVTLFAPAGLKSGEQTMPELEISRTDGKAPRIKQYLGALAHIVIVPLSGEKILHVHPMEGSSPTRLKMHTEFPAAGDYRIWVQFKESGKLKTAALSVSVP